MVGLVLLVIVSSAALLSQSASTSTVLTDPSENGSTTIVQKANLCAYYGTGQCCPILNTTNNSIQQGYLDQPIYVTFAPRSAVENIDNICYTMLPLPDDSYTYRLFISTVYCDGTNTVDTSIITQKVLGTFISGSPQCTFVDIIFGRVTDNELQCNTDIIYRCILNGDCPRTPKSVLEPIFGISFVRQRIPQGCWKPINDVILSNGFAEQDYLSLPMKLPSRCVFYQDCNTSPIIQNFQSQVGFIYNNQRPNSLACLTH